MTLSQTPGTFRAALVQMCSGRNVDRNLADATALIRRAAEGGADYIQTPEATTLMELDRDRLLAATHPEEGNPALQGLQALAAELRVWLHIGSMPIRVKADKLANRSFLISPEGNVVARYDKIHMFDVVLPSGESYRESQNYEPGARAVVAPIRWGVLGLAVCYDLRFPHLFRALAHAGAGFLAVPSAFTHLTGRAHWHTLLRARAIENQAYIFAAAQGGRHEHGRETYGHSLIVSPWGDVLAEGGTEPGVIAAEVDVQALADIRGRMPCLTHDRPFAMT